MSEQTTTSTDISTILGFSQLSELEQTQVITEIGDLVLESAILRLVSELTPEQNEALEQFVSTEPKAEVLLSHLLIHHESFSRILEEEAEQFRADAREVFQKNEN